MRVSVGRLKKSAACPEAVAAFRRLWGSRLVEVTPQRILRWLDESGRLDAHNDLLWITCGAYAADFEKMSCLWADFEYKDIDMKAFAVEAAWIINSARLRKADQAIFTD